jgi:hypothetical protein
VIDIFPNLKHIFVSIYPIFLGIKEYPEEYKVGSYGKCLLRDYPVSEDSDTEIQEMLNKSDFVFDSEEIVAN